MTLNKYPNTSTGFSGKLGFLAGAFLAVALASPAGAVSYNFRYYKFQTTDTLGGGNAIQMSEFKFLNGATRYKPDLLDGGSIYNLPGGESPVGEDSSMLNDDDTSTKWFNFGGGAEPGMRAVVFDFGDSIATYPTIDSYTFVTAQGGATLDGENSRNPKSWYLQGSDDGETWTTLDVRTDNPTPLTATTEITPAFQFPTVVDPLAFSFTASDLVVLDGTGVVFTYDTSSTSVSITPGPAVTYPASGTATIVPPPSADTVFTLTASTASPNTATKQVLVRSVAGGSSTGRYVRFSPLTTQDGNIQLADLLFYNASNVEVIPNVVTYTDGTLGEGNETPNMLRDDDPTTKWYSGTTRPVIFDFDQSVSIASYKFTLAADADGWSGRTPRRWTMEISDDAFTWTKIEDFTAFDYPMPAVSGAEISLPLPGISEGVAPTIDLFRAYRAWDVAGQPIRFEWNTSGAELVEIDVPGGDNLPSGGTFEFVPTGAATYTITATSIGGSSTKEVSFGAPDTAPPSPVAFANFNTAGAGIELNGDAYLVNDSPQMPQGGDNVRLRLTPDLGSKVGTAWLSLKQPVGNSFSTSFGFQLTTVGEGGRNGAIYGAEGLSFVIQNTGTTLLPTTDNGPASNALTINFSTWDNDSPGLVEGQMKLYAGSATVPILSVDLAPLVPFRGSPYGTLTGGITTAPYNTQISYANGLLDVTIDNVVVLDDYAIDLQAIGAVDPLGQGYVGFLAQNGGWSQSSDIVSWSLTTGSVGEPPLQLLSSSINGVAGTGSLSWVSVPGNTYRISASTNLELWVPLTGNEGIPATGAATTHPFTFTPSPTGKAFFRVEDE